MSPSRSTPAPTPRTVADEVSEALRCTEHIEDRAIRAKYIVQTLKLDGYVIQARGADGRFVEVAP